MTVFSLVLLASFLIPGKSTWNGVTKRDTLAAKGKNENELSVAEIFAQCGPGVARVQHRFGTGSGFLIAPEVVVTNCHVINGDLLRHLEVSFPSAEGAGKSRSAILLYSDRKRDLAILKVGIDHKPLTLASSDSSIGEKVIVIGSPAAERPGQVALNTVTDGLLSNKNIKLNNGSEYHQLSVPINPGNSGGPVINMRGDVIGVATGTLQNKQAMNYAIPLSDLRNVVEKIKQQSDKDREQSAAEHDFIEIFRRVAKSASYCSIALEFYSKEMIRAVENKESIDLGVKRASEKHDQELEELLNKELAPIAADRIRVLSHKAVSANARERLRELWDLFLEMKSLIDRPRGTLADFLSKTRDFKERKDRMIGGLQLELGVESLD